MHEQKKQTALADFLHDRHTRHIPSGQIILYEGDTPMEIYILKAGVIKVYDIDEQGNEKVLHLVKPPALIPFAFFSGIGGSLQWFYISLTDCDVYVIPATKMIQATREDCYLSEALTNAFSVEVHELLVRLSSLGKTNVRDKVLAALKFLMVSHATERRTGWWRVDFTVSHQLIGDMCGITRESAALVMKELQNEKVVRYPRITLLEINKQKLTS